MREALLDSTISAKNAILLGGTCFPAVKFSLDETMEHGVRTKI